MRELEIPGSVRQELEVFVARRREAERQRRACERRERKRRLAAERRRRERLMPVAEKVIDWARALAADGVLDPLGGEGLPVYESEGGSLGSRTRMDVRADGALVIWRATRFAGARHEVRAADDLLELAVDGDVIALADSIDSGAVWTEIRRLIRS